MSTSVNDQAEAPARRRMGSVCSRGIESRPIAVATALDSVAGIAAELERIAASVEHLYGTTPAFELSVYDAVHSLHRAIAAIREAEAASPPPANAEHWIG
jgi:hypothetical protein